MKSDVVVFDSQSIIDRATFTQPTELSEGVRFVLVNGQVALSEGKPTGTCVLITCSNAQSTCPVDP